MKKEFWIRQPLFDFVSSAKKFFWLSRFLYLIIQKLLGVTKNREAEKVSYHALNQLVHILLPVWSNFDIPQQLTKLWKGIF